ncbi:MAG: N-acetyltransferase [Bacteroidetes bacterium]|nr:MAG: N-acetyltransferase [Bacteroidota bacterium]
MQIEKIQPEDIPEVVDLWYETSLKAHDFIDPQYWNANRELMKNRYIPMADTFIAREEERITGFASVMENYLAAVFVLPQFQGRGVGSALLGYVKTLRDHLTLKVFVRNTKSVEFYHAHGFSALSEQEDEETGEKELVMEWRK